MTQDDVIRLAREADSGFEGGKDADGTMSDSIVGLEAVLRFAKLVAAHEREACAKVCASLSDQYVVSYYGSEVDALDEAERQILARDNKPEYEECPFIECACDGHHPFGKGPILPEGQT